MTECHDVQLRRVKTVAVKASSMSLHDATGAAIENELACYSKLKALGDADHVLSMIGLCDDAPDGKVWLLHATVSSCVSHVAVRLCVYVRRWLRWSSTLQTHIERHNGWFPVLASCGL